MISVHSNKRAKTNRQVTEPRKKRMDAPGVTIAINTYNYGHLVSRAIASALDQDYSEGSVEILIIDDGSTDDTAAEIRRFGGSVKYIKQPNRGQAAAINTALRTAESEIICLLDADDQFYPNKLRRVVEAFGEHPNAGVVLNRFDIVDQNGSLIEACVPARLICTGLRDRALFWRAPGIPTSGISLRKSIAQRIHIPQDAFRICADSFLLSILPVMTDTQVVLESLHRYVLHGENYYQSLDARSRTGALIARRAHTAAYAEQYIGTRFFTHPDIAFDQAFHRKPWRALQTFFSALLYVNRSKVSLPIKFKSVARCALSGAKGLLLSLRRGR
jgi:glycosyltransferase involved in cell wall biosynthesis